MRPNFDLNPFSDRARPAIYTSRKDFHVYRLYRGRNSVERWHLGAEKSEKSEKIEEKSIFQLESV